MAADASKKIYENVNILCPQFSATLTPEESSGKAFLFIITKTELAFWKLVNKALMLRDSRRPDRIDQNKRFRKVPANLGGDRDTPSFGSLPLACSESGTKVGCRLALLFIFL